MIQCIIPARIGSTRLPGKPLLAETGKPLILHTIEAAKQAKSIDRVCVVTDSKHIHSVVGCVRDVDCVRTNPDVDYPTGTDRVARAVELLDLAADDIVINLQGDEPEMPPDYLDLVASMVNEDRFNPFVATLGAPLRDEEWANSSCVKALTRSRTAPHYAIDFCRALPAGLAEDWLRLTTFQPLGVYAMRACNLLEWSNWERTDRERTHSLEQLRINLEVYRVQVGVVAVAHKGIDTPEDYAAFVRRQADKAQALKLSGGYRNEPV